MKWPDLPAGALWAPPDDAAWLLLRPGLDRLWLDLEEGGAVEQATFNDECGENMVLPPAPGEGGGSSP